jgi:hypothetical protein
MDSKDPYAENTWFPTPTTLGSLVIGAGVGTGAGALTRKLLKTQVKKVSLVDYITTPYTKTT